MSHYTVTQPIVGSWFEFQHHNRAEGVYWNPACACFDATAWHAKVGEMAAIGLEYLVLMAVALDHKTFYPSRLLLAWEMACPDSLEALLQAADDHGIKVFVGNDFWGQWDSPGIIADARACTGSTQWKNWLSNTPTTPAFTADTGPMKRALVVSLTNPL